MRIAICDDEPAVCVQLEEYIHTYRSDLKYCSFYSAKDLLLASEENFFDIIFMDIEMDSPNGFEASISIMERADKPLIIFVTNSSDYTIRGYGVAFRYLKKPVTYSVFCNVLDLALSQAVPQKLAIPVGCSTKLLSLKEIYYFEIYGHILKVHTTETIYTCRLSISIVKDKLDGTEFAQPHKSYLVNLWHIDYLTSKEIWMTNGDRIPISSLRKDKFTELFKNFIRGH